MSAHKKKVHLKDISVLRYGTLKRNVSADQWGGDNHAGAQFKATWPLSLFVCFLTH